MIDRFLRRFTGRLLHADGLGILLVIFALLTFANGIASSLRTTDTTAFYWICLVSAAISFGLGRLRWNGIQASAGMAALGVLYVWILGARLTQPLLNLLNAVWSIIPKMLPALQQKNSLDLSAIHAVWMVIGEASVALWARIQIWALGFTRNITINDALVRNMAWGLMLWLCAAWMGWFARKRNAVASLLPSMVLLSIVTSYSEYRVDSLWIMSVLLLLLMGIWNYRSHTLHWLKSHIDYSDSIRVDSGMAVIMLTVTISTFAFITPSISWREILDTVRERQEGNEAAEMLGVKQPPKSPADSTAGGQPTLPREHLLNGAVANSEKIVMTIRTGELPPVPQEILHADVPHYYWRSTVYDRYVGTGWVTSAVFPQSVSADTPLIPGLLDGYRLVHLDVKMVEPGGRLFWSGTLFSADVPSKVSWRVRPPLDLFADQQTLLLADMFAASTNVDSYRAEVYVPIPTVGDLRNASADYPEEIRTRYLSLPASLPNRVRDLARQLTDGPSNPYEKTKAIESYLRTNYPYTLDVPVPPEGRDVADYFLFDLKKGYCDYYATAMVVLLRSSGVPARFVSGYSPGSYDAPNAQYIVRELNAHSWVEVYFPEIGWVEFEPTASQPEIDRPEKPPSIILNSSGEQSATDLLTRFRAEKILLWSSPILSILMAAVLYFILLERWLVLRLAPQAAIENVYQRFYQSGRPLAGVWISTETSTEFLGKVLDRVNDVMRSTRFEKLSVNASRNATALTELYHASLFVDHHVLKDDAVNAWHLWMQLRMQLVGIKLLMKLKIVRPTIQMENDQA